MTPEQLRDKADALAKLADTKLAAGPQELKPAEKEHLAAKKRQDDKIAADQARAAGKGLKKG